LPASKLQCKEKILIPHLPDWVAPAQKALTEELTPFMEEYIWLVDNGTQGDLYRAMCTPTVMYYNNCQKHVHHGYDEADEFEHAHAGKKWLKHQMDRLTILSLEWS